MNYHIPQFATKDELFKYLVDNKSLLIKQKKSTIKRCDAFTYVVPNVESHDFATKDIAVTSNNPDFNGLLIKIVGNTTNLMDCHDDVHIPGLWKKTLTENTSFLHLQEHEMEFDKVICDEMKCYTKTMSWASLGQSYKGSTQALIGESTAEIDRNAYMCEQYKKGYVKNHSVGMQYVNVVMCVNSGQDYYKEYKANWDKYYPQVANQDRANETGFFWAVLEAKLIEISAVVKGSNYVTPTQSVIVNTTTSDCVCPDCGCECDTEDSYCANCGCKLNGAGKATPSIINEPPLGTQKSYLDIAGTILQTIKTKK